VKLLCLILSLASAGAPAYRADLRTALAWVDRQQLADGAILYGTNEIEPYYANIAAAGMAVEPSQLPRVRAWMNWYVTHLNARDRWGLSGTIYDYRYARGAEIPLRKADSVDSYAATFFTLARALYDGGDSVSRAYVVSIRPQLEEMAAMLTHVTQPDGMTIALPDYPVAYVMDNSEVYRGLSDLAYLESAAFANGPRARAYAARARRVAGGIATLWSPLRGTYESGRQEPRGPSMPSKWTRWYPDATAQLFPALQGVIAPQSPRAAALWAAFNAAWPQWDELKNGDPGGFPWALVGTAAVVQGDDARAAAFARSVRDRYAREGFPFPWYVAESGWYARALAGLLGLAPREPGARR
jgi:hypothetical protein